MPDSELFSRTMQIGAREHLQQQWIWTGTAGAIKGIIASCGKAPPAGICPTRTFSTGTRLYLASKIVS